MMKKCELWLGTRTSFFRWSVFDSIAECKRYIKSCVTCYYEIKVIEEH